jgi:hypothetical protein
MAVFKIPSFEDKVESRLRNSAWYAQHVEGLALPVRKLAELGLQAFWRASEFKVPALLYNSSIFEPVPNGNGALRVPAMNLDFLDLKVQSNHRKVRERWLGGLGVLAFTAGASAVISHPEAHITETGQSSGRAHLVLPGANREAAHELLRAKDGAVALRDGLPMYAAVQWRHHDGSSPQVAVSVRQEPSRHGMPGDVTGVRMANSSYDTVDLLTTSFDMQGDFPVERGRLGLAELHNLSNALLVATQVVQR